MIRVYLDNNILVDIEDGKYHSEAFLIKPHIEYYYSDAHMSELLNGIDNGLVGLKEKRLSTIKRLCGNRFLVQDAPGYKRSLAICEPSQAFENAERLGYMRRPINSIVQNFTPNRVAILNELNVDPREVGSLNPDEVFEAIEKRLLSSDYHFSIEDYLRLSEASVGRTVFASLFNLLDMVSYRKDKDSVARLYDASHAYYAQMCHILVTNDARMRLKSEAVYHYLKIRTLVMDGDSFLTSNFCSLVR